MAGMTALYRNYFDDNAAPMTVHERDYLESTAPPHRSAFCPRPQKRESARKLPRSLPVMTINHRMRTSVSESVQPKPSPPFRMWIELGRRAPPFPPKWDESYNSNVWQNFSHGEGYRINSPGNRINDTVAIAYPLGIPSHSDMKQNTLSKYLSESKGIIKDGKRKDIALAKSKKELKQFKILKLRSQMRVPSMDSDGNILPPDNMKHYDHPEIKLLETTTVSLRSMEEHERDIDRYMLGTHRTTPARLWKLSFKDNNPEFVKIQEDMRERNVSPSTSGRHTLSPAPIYFK